MPSTIAAMERFPETVEQRLQSAQYTLVTCLRYRPAGWASSKISESENTVRRAAARKSSGSSAAIMGIFPRAGDCRAQLRRCTQAADEAKQVRQS